MKPVRLIKMCLNETHNKVRNGKHLSDKFPIQNGLKQGDALSPLLFTFTLECPGKPSTTKIKGASQLLVYTDDVNLLGDNIDTIDASKEVGLKVNAEKTKYMLLTRHKNTGQTLDIKIANRSFENVAQFKYLGTTVANKNFIHEEIRSNACYHSVQNLPAFRLLFEKKLKYTELYSFL
jgi:hypothetical protein